MAGAFCNTGLDSFTAAGYSILRIQQLAGEHFDTYFNARDEKLTGGPTKAILTI